MAVHIGIDLGSVSVKAALFSSDPEDREFFESASGSPILRRVERLRRADGSEACLAVTHYRRISGNPHRETRDLIDSLVKAVGPDRLGEVTGTGSGASFLNKQFALPAQNEFRAIAKAVELLHPDVHTVFEMGGENSKYLLLETDRSSGRVGIADYSTNGDCAAGTGGFLDQQAGRLRFTVEEIGRIVLETPRSARIAGRCSVFAKSDMIHAQQKGFTPAEILKGLCEAVARNFKSAITRGKKVEPRVAFIGGVAANRGVVQAIETVFEWEPGTLLIPEFHDSFAAVGAAVMAGEKAAELGRTEMYDLDRVVSEEPVFPHSKPLSMENVVLLRDRMTVVPPEDVVETRDAFLGIDIGSVSTNLVVIDEDMNVLKEIYTRTDARPIEAVGRGLKEIEAELGDRILIRGVATTGSGRELIGELVGADTVHDEITAHKTGAAFIGQTILNMQVDTIFEIGGQDSKFISLEQGVVVDFAMNEACAAGTGSFLEERARELGIEIKGEFAEIALSSRTPIRLGERCTVFMEQDVNSYLQLGAPLNDVVGGLAYSIATNYINRVVRGRKIGKVIFFQGGTAYNDSVAAAFSSILGRQVIVPPFNGVMGALGVAILAREKMLNNRERSKFRGFDLEKVDYRMREFTCKACSNFCQMQEFTVDNERTYWGDKCSERYRKAVKCEREPVIDNLVEFRRNQLLAGYDPEYGNGPVVGIPWTMSLYEWAPFWFRIFRELGVKVLLSEQTTSSLVNLGMESVVSEPCFPIQAAHGHLRSLIDRGVDYLLTPNFIAAPGNDPTVVSFYCPWNMTLPYIAKSAPVIEEYRDRMICPTVWFNHGDEEVARAIHASFREVGLRWKYKRVRAAVLKGLESQQAFREALLGEGGRALALIQSHHEHGIILLGRPYNIYDRGINLDLAHKLRTYYGANVVPIDFLNLEPYMQAQNDINDNMFWSYGKKILAAASFIKNKPRLHIIYITNFKCGPDSYIKHFVAEASGRPYLTLQFDGHNNDAGMLTRCEAYLDSKGVLRRWGTTQEEMAAGPSSR